MLLSSAEGNAVISVLYTDEECTKFVSGSTSFWTNAPLDQCTSKDGYSVHPVCEAELSNSVKKLSHSNAYLRDDSCHDDEQLIQQQYFVTDQCFVVGGSSSRKQVCDKNKKGLEVKFYNGTACEADKTTSVIFYHEDECYAPWQPIPPETTNLNLLMETTYRVLDCKYEEDDDDDDEEYGGLTIGGLVGVIVGGVVVIAFGLGMFFHLNKKPTEGMESLLANEH